jgi:hypothetical protein
VEWLVYARDAARARASLAALPGLERAALVTADDPSWATATRVLRSLASR